MQQAGRTKFDGACKGFVAKTRTMAKRRNRRNVLTPVSNMGEHWIGPAWI